MGLLDDIFDIPMKALGAVADVAGIPTETLKKIAEKVDPHDDVAIRSAAHALNVPTESLRESIREIQRESE